MQWKKLKCKESIKAGVELEGFIMGAEDFGWGANENRVEKMKGSKRCISLLLLLLIEKVPIQLYFILL